MATTAHINRIAVGVPPHDVHQAFLHFTETLFREDSGTLLMFRRMAERSGIEHRYSCLPLMPDWKTGPTLDAEGLYTRGRFANTAARMRVFEECAPELAVATIGQLDLGAERDSITHLVVTSCTGFSAPGIDLQVLERCGLPTSVERTMVGFATLAMSPAAAGLGLPLMGSFPGLLTFGAHLSGKTNQAYAET